MTSLSPRPLMSQDKSSFLSQECSTDDHLHWCGAVTSFSLMVGACWEQKVPSQRPGLVRGRGICSDWDGGLCSPEAGNKHQGGLWDHGLSLTFPSLAHMTDDLLTRDIPPKAHPGCVCTIVMFWNVSCFSAVPHRSPCNLSFKNFAFMAPKMVNTQMDGVLFLLFGRIGGQL